ncbi:MAG: hypothetical protein D3921_03215 [Candidatus Electrothrix sp. AW1]|nr:hypothetical protein [Candidatus Electrothrix sp. AX1]MCI5181531.1 hypothetical protein [Candidatus Electrothrix gigas]
MNSLSSAEKKVPQEVLINEQQNQPKRIGIVWYVVLIMYLILLGSTAYVTFFDNNGFASRQDTAQKLAQITNEDQLAFFNEIHENEVQNMEQINALATQSFNVVLGALLGFLSATVTILTGKEEQTEPDESS